MNAWTKTGQDPNVNYAIFEENESEKRADVDIQRA